MNDESVIRFIKEVHELAKRYNVNYFIVSDGVSATRNNGNDAVFSARQAHRNWEIEHGFDPDEITEGIQYEKTENR